MLKRIHSEFRNTIEKLKWFFSILAERIKVEIAIIKILGKNERVERERKEILSIIGNRVSELKNTKRMNIYDDAEISDALARLEKLEKEISVLKQEAEDISTLEA